MPFYEYQCKACGAEVEVLQKITDAPLKKCPECGKNQLAKLVSAPVFRLKGGGWYETDFKTDKDNKRNLVDSDKGGSKAEEKSDAKADAKPESKADAKAESKPEAKVESKSEPRPAAKSKSRAVARPVKKKPAGKAKSKARR
jgi:putative FmdB family regulatory protein